MDELSHPILLSTLKSSTLIEALTASLPTDWTYEPLPDGTYYYDAEYNHHTAMLPRDFSNCKDPTQVRIFPPFSCSIGVRCQHAGYVHTGKRLYLVMLSDSYPYVQFARQNDRSDDSIREFASITHQDPKEVDAMFEACFLVFGLRSMDWRSHRDPCFTIAVKPEAVVRQINESESVPPMFVPYWEPSIKPAIRKVN